ncbi:MAG: ATP-binding cassette domain-containing protein [Rhizobiales bacterium]|nr:ATP-binding cassette domain-containing protein [Hyphomicrobiales bacterium]
MNRHSIVAGRVTARTRGPTGELPALELEGVSKFYGSVVAARNLDLEVGRGEFMTLLGPSGSGKTTALRLIGGFERPTSGAIRIDGRRVERVPAYGRDTATIFQSGALFPHMTVSENVAYGLKLRKVPAGEIAERVASVLEIVRLSGLEGRYPSQMSGGQKQRVALARSIVVKPSILLFDEPLSALDLALRLQLRTEIKRLHERLGFTAIFVTHDQGEATALSTRVAVMNRGSIEQCDTPEEVFRRPANEFIFSFIGESCRLDMECIGGKYRDTSGAELDLTLSNAECSGPCRLYVRPSCFKHGGAAAECPNRLRIPVDVVEFLGEAYRYHASIGASEVFFDVYGTRAHAVGDVVELGWGNGEMCIYRGDSCIYQSA